jgi:hypothetical protein
MHFLHSVYYELTASTCFEHYFPIFRKCCTNDDWYIACVLGLLAATRVVMAHLVETVRYKLDRRGFDSRLCHLNFSLA